LLEGFRALYRFAATEGNDTPFVDVIEDYPERRGFEDCHELAQAVENFRRK
jgi:hypothetical protein